MTLRTAAARQLRTLAARLDRHPPGRAHPDEAARAIALTRAIISGHPSVAHLGYRAPHPRHPADSPQGDPAL